MPVTVSQIAFEGVSRTLQFGRRGVAEIVGVLFALFDCGGSVWLSTFGVGRGRFMASEMSGACRFAFAFAAFVCVGSESVAVMFMLAVYYC